MAGTEATGRRARLALLALVALAALSTLVVGPADPASVGAATTAAAENRAVVVIDDGTTRTVRCVRFTSDFVTGLEALERSGAAVTAATFGGMGKAVCAIDGIGCALSGCLTCKAPAYWHYFRAVSGGFAPSGVGASTAKVHDGDVEGWGWGTSPSVGSVPAVDAVCGPRPSPSPSPAPASPSPVPPAAAAPSPGAAPPSGDAAASAPGPGARSAARDVGDDTSTTDPDADGDGDDRRDPGGATAEVDGDGEAGDEGLAVEQAAAVGQGTDGGSGNRWLAPLVVVVVLAALAGWGVRIRTRRAAVVDTAP